MAGIKKTYTSEFKKKMVKKLSYKQRDGARIMRFIWISTVENHMQLTVMFYGEEVIIDESIPNKN